MKGHSLMPIGDAAPQPMGPTGAGQWVTSRNRKRSLYEMAQGIRGRGGHLFSDDGQRTILTVKLGDHRMCSKQQTVGGFPTLRLAQEAAEEATDE
jgi:hypothetical protein